MLKFNTTDKYIFVFFEWWYLSTYLIIAALLLPNNNIIIIEKQWSRCKKVRRRCNIDAGEVAIGEDVNADVLGNLEVHHGLEVNQNAPYMRQRAH